MRVGAGRELHDANVALGSAFRDHFQRNRLELLGMSSDVVVDFVGEGSGTGELTWGQLDMWQSMQRTTHTMNIGGAMELPAGKTVQEIAAMLRFLLSRHQALRTRLKFVPGAEFPLQEVCESGSVGLTVVDVQDSAAAAAAAAEQLRAGFEAQPFDHASEWPVRMGVIRRRATLTHLVVQYSHVAVDGGGIRALGRDLSRMDSGDPPAAAFTPLELAAWQRSAAGLRQSGKSLRYWESELRRIPQEKYLGSPAEPRFWELLCYSPALHLALQAIAARTGVDTGHVLLAAYAVAIARVTGVSPSVAQVVVSNRFRPLLRDAVTQLTQAGICVIDVAGCSFDEAVARAWKAHTAASLHSYCDPLPRNSLVAQICPGLDLSNFINDRRAPSTMPAAPTPASLRDALERTVRRWDRKQAAYNGRLFLQIDSGPDINTPGRSTEAESGQPAVYYAIWADTHYLAPAAVEAFAAEMEAAAVNAALDGTRRAL